MDDVIQAYRDLVAAQKAHIADLKKLVALQETYIQSVESQAEATS